MGGEILKEADAAALAKWSEQEVKSTEQAKKDTLRAQLEEEINPRRSCLHNFFIFVSVMTICAAILMLIGQIIGIYFSKSGLVQLVLRLYVIVLCVVVVLNELELTSMTRDSAVLRVWATRGFFYTFIGILGLEEIQASPANRNEDSVGRVQALNFVLAIAWVMVGIGVLYFGMGVMCLQLVSNRLRSDYQHRLDRSSETRRATQTYAGVSPEVV